MGGHFCDVAPGIDEVKRVYLVKTETRTASTVITFQVQDTGFKKQLIQTSSAQFNRSPSIAKHVAEELARAATRGFNRSKIRLLRKSILDQFNLNRECPSFRRWVSDTIEHQLALWCI